MMYEIWSLGCKPFEKFSNYEVSSYGILVYQHWSRLCIISLKTIKKLKMDIDSHLLLVVPELYTK